MWVFFLGVVSLWLIQGALRLLSDRHTEREPGSSGGLLEVSAIATRLAAFAATIAFAIYFPGLSSDDPPPTTHQPHHPYLHHHYKSSREAPIETLDPSEPYGPDPYCQYLPC